LQVEGRNALHLRKKTLHSEAYVPYGVTKSLQTMRFFVQEGRCDLRACEPEETVHRIHCASTQ